MSIVRLVLGHTGGARPSPAVTSVISNTARYFLDFETYLVGILGFAHMTEASNGGHSSPYRPEDTAMIGCKQSPAEWFWRAEPTVSSLTKNFANTELFLQRNPGPLAEPNATLNLGAMGALMHNFGQALGTNYYERNVHSIRATYPGGAHHWPAVWDFGRVIRNAMSHGGRIHFDTSATRSVSWKELTYSPSDNGRHILHTDIWPGDLFDLIIEMDTHIP